MQQVIVYRSQAEANIDQALMNSDFILYFIGAILFVCIFAGVNNLVQKFYGGYVAGETSYYQLGASLIISFLIVKFFIA